MIGSFWNLCRACPSMPVDKLHSEYRSTYRWHEYTGGSRPEVIRKPPIANQFASSTEHFFSKSTEEERHVEGAINEPPLPRRKKCPELAYKTHEFISCDQQQQQQLPPPSSTLIKNEYNSANRARSEARTGTPSRRSKSEGPHRIPNGFAYPIHDRDDAAINKDPNGVKAAAGESSGLFKKTITKLSTEYRLQFIWPYTRKDTNVNIPNNNNYQINNNYNHNANQCTTDVDAVDFPKKSLSMGAIKATQSNAMPTVHKKRTTHEKEATTQELEPLFNNADENRKETKNRSNTRPFSQYGVNDVKYRQIMTEKENFGFSDDANIKPDNKMLVNGIDPSHNISLYRNVVELRKKAGEYRNRGWGGEFKPDLYNKHKALLDQVSRRSSLSALSLASTVHRPISKEEKDKENTKKTSPSKNYGRYNNIRHHLERTTGPDVEEGTLLPSPTREKLQPTIPKSKEDESYNSQRGSPKKNAASSRHGSPQKSPKKILKQARSQSVGPTVTNTDGSPKRRAGSAVPTAAGTPSSNNVIVKTHKKTPVSTPTIVERRPRPTTLSTSNHSRSKSSTLPLSSTSGRANHLSGPTTGIHHQQIQSLQNDTNTTIKKLSPASLTIPNLKKAYRPITKPQHQRPKSMIVSGHNDPMTESTINFDQLRRTTKGQQKKTAENEDDTDKDGYGGFGGTSISSASPQPPHDHIIEHIVKSPPEPTRVKSPEQIIMRSPDPVNWTVPLDTGKTFTVTQNVRDGILGESIVRPQSEFKAASISSDIKPTSAPQSAPPELAEQANMEAWKNEKEPQNEIEIKSEISSASMSTAGTTTGTPSTAIGSTATSVGSTVGQPNENAITTTTAQIGPSTMHTVPDVRFDKPVPGTTLRCLDDPTFDPEINSPGTGNTRGGTITQTDVLEKARDRFDRFWGSSKEENV